MLESAPSIPGDSGQPSTCRDLWHEALEKLPVATRKKLETQDSGQKKSVREQTKELSQAVRERQQEVEAKFWRFRVGGQEIILRDYADKISTCLQTIATVAENFAPPQASIPCSIVKSVV